MNEYERIRAELRKLYELAAETEARIFILRIQAKAVLMAEETLKGMPRNISAASATGFAA